MNNYSDCGKEFAENTVENSTVDYSDVALIPQTNSVLNAIREWAKSKLFLITMIALILTVVLSIVSSFTTSGRLQAEGDMINNVSMHVAAKIMGNVIIMTPCILMVVGMYITYSSASTEGEKISAKGLGFIRASLIIASIFVALLVVGMICWVPIFYGARDVFEPLLSHKFGEYPTVDGWAFLGVLFGAVMMFVVVLIVVIMIIMIILLILAFIGIMRALRSVRVIRLTLEKGVVAGKISAFAAVVSIILGSFSALLSLSMLSMDVMEGISSLVFAVTLILLGVILFTCRSKINKALKEQAN